MANIKNNMIVDTQIIEGKILVIGMYPHVNGHTYQYDLEIDRDGGDTRLIYVALWENPEIPVTSREIRKTLAHAAEHMRSAWIEDGTIYGTEAADWTYKISY